jgi:acyl-CoA synthetase (AMP-forming)/AMP-acid ligase II
MRLMSSGRPLANTRVQIVDSAGERLPDCHIGEIALQSDCMLTGYHNRPDVKTPITPDGFYITGDVFRRDKDGFYNFIGRTDDMFVSGGENIYPADIERMLERHPAVGQAVVIPVDDDIKGTKPVAFVIPKAGQQPSADEIKQFALANAPAYAHPRFVWFIDDLPLASTNKVDRVALRKVAQQRVAEAVQ